jgi:transposase
MGARFRQINRDTPFLLPVDMREWVPEDDLAHFVLEAVQAVPLSRFRVNERGTGSKQYPPHMLLSLLIYCYANGIFGSRRIERATYRDLGVRLVAGNTHPDHDTICKFRRENFEAVGTAFLEVLRLAHELKLLKVGTISVDGTHIKANASKYHAVTYGRACELEQQLELEIAKLMQKAEEADNSPEAEGQSIPEELTRREALRAKVAEARRKLEQRAAARAEAEQPEYERKVEERDKRPGSRKGPKPKPPSSTPDANEQVNMTDEDSRIMRKSKKSEYRQAYNSQATVDADGSQLVLASDVTNCASDAGELLPGVKSVPEELGSPTEVLADSGYVNADVFDQLRNDGVEPYVPPSRDAAHQRRKHDFRPSKDVPAKPLNDLRLRRMRAKLDTDAGRAMYAKRKKTVEPVFGIIKEAMGFRQFLLRGLEKVRGEWGLVCLAYNFKRLHGLIRA